MIAPVLEELSKTLEDVVFLKVNFVLVSGLIFFNPTDTIMVIVSPRIGSASVKVLN